MIFTGNGPGQLGAGIGRGKGTHGMTRLSLLSALRSERKSIKQALRNLERDRRHPRVQNVIPMRRDILASDEDREVADLAFDIWLSNGFRGGSPEERSE